MSLLSLSILIHLVSLSLPIALAIPANGASNVRRVSSPHSTNQALQSLNLINNVTDGANSTDKPLTMYQRPECFPTHPIIPVIAIPSDCEDANLHVISSAMNPENPILWTSFHRWVYRTCEIAIIPIPDIKVPYDMLSFVDIAREAWAIQSRCVNEAHAFRGGSRLVGNGDFEVQISAPRRESRLQERALTLPYRVQPSILSKSTNTSSPPLNPLTSPPLYAPSCYRPSTPFHPIAHPPDCSLAIAKIPEDAPFYPETWDESRVWLHRSCVIWLVPVNVEDWQEDVFSRQDVVDAAMEVRRVCVSEEEGWKGGVVLVGGKGGFDVSVGALFRGR